MATPKDRYLRKSYTEGLDKVLKKAADADIEEARKEADMNIEKTGTFTIDLEPNWNKVIQLAIERLGSDNKQTKSNGAELILECVKPMAEKGVDLWVEQDANVMGGGCHLLGSSDLALWADEAVKELSRTDPDPPSENRLPGMEQDEIDRRCTNFIKLIGDRLERNRQARRSFTKLQELSNQFVD
jgi:hypothetical protein